ncbi:Oidioi.mRNA.OKI2018_I69.chr2.g8421.t1.cds [Oikopleura dioica]|uniref:Oidioi.mRNA.OKI2018_I69.chr2.g8421.t1.cds n=1 Tax=Oikopleura dioica TaxID=34765 RepID=A0ABN7T9N1_OIKDI|nr:Oidioi.mRNA.OKI2018_I69.chr2.g8421.t1.cds [Oikopleura dioica]
MQVFSPNDINIYDLSGGKNLPDFLSMRKRKEMLRKDVSLRRRIDLIQGFEMPTVNTRVKCTKDGQYIYTAGCYKPTIKCFETSQLSLKFERCVDFEVVDLHILTDDYQKLALLGSDRTIEFHTSSGKHAKLRIPKFGRELEFYPANSEVLVAASGNEVYRISLEEGRFLQPYQMAMDEAMSIAVSPEHYLVSLGGSESTVECWDPRARSAVGCVKLPQSDSGVFSNISKVVYLSGLEIAAGTEDGRVAIYDLRQRAPLVVKDHMWCSFLDMLTEELEESKTDVIYDDYKFLTLPELKSLSLESLVGTNLLRAYMHGYFIDNRLYQKAKLASDPFAFEEYKAKQVETARTKDRKRAPIVEKVKVNPDLYVKMKENGAEKVDDRFGDLFTDKAFQIDEESERYNQLKPVSSTKVRKRADSSSDEEKTAEDDLVPDVFVPEKPNQRADSERDSLDSESDSEADQAAEKKKQVRKTKKMTVRNGVDLGHFYDSNNTTKLKEQRRVEELIPMSKRIDKKEMPQSRNIRGGRVFEMEVGKKKDKQRTKDTMKHIKERRTNIRKAESLLKKHRPKKT